ncbi:unnamed protein product [Durusdinium trenchii]|uniref:C3H1-type domain-containing protein n=1 Tax=Durusdinium trenchii TaxID=1381693 RepID=A0ABP0QSP9_9DINO
MRPAAMPIQQGIDLANEVDENTSKAPPEKGHVRSRPGFVSRKMCSYIDSIGYCQKGDACIFAHSPAELANGDDRSSGPETSNVYAKEAEVEEDTPGQVASDSSSIGPRNFDKDFRPSKLCRIWIQHPSQCSDSCTFAHGLMEMAGGVNMHLDKLAAAGLFGRKAAAAVAESTMPPVIQPGLALFTGQRAASGKGYKGSGGAGAAVPNGKGDSFGPDFAELNLFNVRPFPDALRPTKLCAFWMQDPWMCQKGEQCTFAHGLPELRADVAELSARSVSRFHHTGFKPKVMCKNIAKGHCYKGLVCTFAHSMEEMV